MHDFTTLSWKFANVSANPLGLSHFYRAFEQIATINNWWWQCIWKSTCRYLNTANLLQDLCVKKNYQSNLSKFTSTCKDHISTWKKDQDIFNVSKVIIKAFKGCLQPFLNYLESVKKNWNMFLILNGVKWKKRGQQSLRCKLPH